MSSYSVFDFVWDLMLILGPVVCLVYLFYKKFYPKELVQQRMKEMKAEEERIKSLRRELRRSNRP